MIFIGLIIGLIIGFIAGFLFFLFAALRCSKAKLVKLFEEIAKYRGDF